MAKIQKVQAREILDNRGVPTVEAKVSLDDYYYGRFAFPSAVSLTKYEAKEKRDGDPLRFAGLGVQKAVSFVVQEISPKIIGLDSQNQEEIDKILIALDGTADKERLGANAILSVSLACAQASAASLRVPFYYYLNQKFFKDRPLKIPIPIFDIINGGKSGASNLDFCQFMVVPSSAQPFPQALQIGVEVYSSLKKILIARKESYSLGDGGGFTPNLYTNAEAFEVIAETVSATSYTPGHDLFFAANIAASQFQQGSLYQIHDRANPMSQGEFIEYYKDLLGRFHILILEDPFGPDDWEGWQDLTVQVGKQTIVSGNEFFATNAKRIKKGVEMQAANAVSIHPAQIGTLTETVEAIKTVQGSFWKIIFSSRLSETNNDTIADLACSCGADYVKFGAPARGERVAKYNRLLEIASTLG
jgi:enolase